MNNAILQEPPAQIAYTIPTINELLKAGFRYALSLTSNHQDSEDLVQQASLKLIRKYGEIANRAIFYRTIRNTFLDQLRRKSVVSITSIDTVPESGKVVSFGADCDLETVLSTLTYDEREAIYLNVVEGYTADEIGERIGKSRGTILSRISRGRKRLNKLKEESFPTEFQSNRN